MNGRPMPSGRRAGPNPRMGIARPTALGNAGLWPACRRGVRAPGRQAFVSPATMQSPEKTSHGASCNALQRFQRGLGGAGQQFMAVDPCLVSGHSAEFVAAWRSVLCSVYRWRREGRFAVVPSLWGAPTFAYLPGLSYADLNEAEARELAQEAAGRPFNIRALSASPGEEALPLGASSVLRINLAAFAHDREIVWERSLSSGARRGVRRARKAGLEASEEAGPGALAAFRGLLSSVLARHGAPMLPTALFEAVVQDLNAGIIVVRNRANGEALASLLWLRDGPLAWMPWIGSRRCPESPGNLLFWAWIEQALAEGAKVVDFGRSPVGSGAYRFKRGFGAVPMPLLWLSDKPTDLHRRYALPQKIWRRLPQPLTNAAGPWLCRYLANY